MEIILAALAVLVAAAAGIIWRPRIKMAVKAARLGMQLRMSVAGYKAMVEVTTVDPALRELRAARLALDKQELRDHDRTVWEHRKAERDKKEREERDQRNWQQYRDYQRAIRKGCTCDWANEKMLIDSWANHIRTHTDPYCDVHTERTL